MAVFGPDGKTDSGLMSELSNPCSFKAPRVEGYDVT